jgi:DivIVA domain repeat protein
VTTFPTVRPIQRGYDIDEVDAFLARARRAYDGEDDGSGEPERLDAAEIRRTAFGLQRAGYRTDSVDAALERLEDVFAERERLQAQARVGDEAWFAQARETAQVILNRLNREAGHRFARANALSYGYSRKDVDRFASRLTRYFRDGKPMSVDEVRTVVFRPQRGGYREPQVDMVLDAVVDVMLAVR